MKKLIGTFAVAVIFAATVFGPNLVKANLDTETAETDFSELAPTTTFESDQSLGNIHPTWKKLGLIPGCDHE